jgi:hypothetical protein
LSEINPQNGLEKEGSLLSFQYFPETIEDSKNPNYSVKSIPGGSHPIRQFVDGGDRNISFVALFVNDENPDKGNDSIAGQLANVSINKLLSGNKRKDSVDIAGAIAWLKSYTYPDYKNNVAIAPPVLILYIPGSGIVGNGKFPDSVTVVMTSCQVTYEAFHRDGTPRVATVSLSFAEMINYYKGWQYVSRDNKQFVDGRANYAKSDNAKLTREKRKNKSLFGI